MCHALVARLVMHMADQSDGGVFCRRRYRKSGVESLRSKDGGRTMMKHLDALPPGDLMVLVCRLSADDHILCYSGRLLGFM